MSDLVLLGTPYPVLQITKHITQTQAFTLLLYIYFIQSPLTRRTSKNKPMSSVMVSFAVRFLETPLINSSTRVGADTNEARLEVEYNLSRI